MEGKRLQSKVISSSAVNTIDQSPERTKRKSKWATERQAPGDVEAVHGRLAENEDGKRRRRLQDPLPLEDATDVANDRSATHPFKQIRPDFLSNSLPSERDINPEYVPRSGYYFEHDDRSSRRPRQNFKWRSSDWQRGTSNWRREDRWLGGNPETSDKKPENRWHHDRFSELQAEELADANRKAAGEHPKNEQIVPDGEDNSQVAASRKIDATGEESASDWKKKDPSRKTGERDEGYHSNMRIEIPTNRAREVKLSRLPSSQKLLERGHWGEDRDLGRIEKGHEQGIPFRGGMAPRFGGRVRERWGGRNERENEVHFHDKWKHDLFEEANRSPTPKQEEDPVAKVEALLAA